jgi:hypothetical protein
MTAFREQLEATAEDLVAVDHHIREKIIINEACRIHDDIVHALHTRLADLAEVIETLEQKLP